MFVVHNLTSQRVGFKLLPATSLPEGAPSWRAKRHARQNTVHVVIEPHLTQDLTKYGYTEKQLLKQPEVLRYLRHGVLKRVKNGGGGYVEKQFEVQGQAPEFDPHEAGTKPDGKPVKSDPEPQPEPEPAPETERAPELAVDKEEPKGPPKPKALSKRTPVRLKKRS